MENDNVNLYLGCETNWVDAAGVYTDGTAAAAGSFLRTIIVDGAGTVGLIDLNIHAAGSFNMITSRWNHVMLRVAPDSMAISLDGAHVGDEAFAVYVHTDYASSAASTFWPTPSALQVSARSHRRFALHHRSSAPHQILQRTRRRRCDRAPPPARSRSPRSSPPRPP